MSKKACIDCRKTVSFYATRCLKCRCLVDNPFKGKKHSKKTIRKMSKIKTGKRYSEETNLKKGLKGDKNPAYRTGYWLTRRKHLKIRKNECEKLDSSCKGRLEIHHSPSMSDYNCLTWSGTVYTLCRKHHMDAHRNKKGVFTSV